MPILGLLVASATVLVNVDRAEDVRVDEAHEIATQIAEAIEAWTGHVSVPRTRPTGACGQDAPKCVRDAKAETGADHVVIVRIYRAVTTTAIFARRLNGASAEVTFPIGETLDASRFHHTAAGLFPRADAPARPPATPPLTTNLPEATSPPSIVGPVAVGLVGVGLAATSLGLYLHSSASVAAADQRVRDATVGGRVVGIDYGMVEADYRSAGDQRTAALGLAVGAGVAVATSVVWWWLTE